MSDNLQDAVSKGLKASHLIGDETLKSIFDDMEVEYIRAWRTSPARDTEGRERLWQAVNIVRLVQDHLNKYAADGRLAKAEIEALATKPI